MGPSQGQVPELKRVQSQRQHHLDRSRRAQIESTLETGSSGRIEGWLSTANHHAAEARPDHDATACQAAQQAKVRLEQEVQIAVLLDRAVANECLKRAARVLYGSVELLRQRCSRLQQFQHPQRCKGGPNVPVSTISTAAEFPRAAGRHAKLVSQRSVRKLHAPIVVYSDFIQ